MGDADDGKVVRAAGTPPVDPALLGRPAVRTALASHDIRSFYRVLGENGWTQREIARATTTQQSGISEILKGRRVSDYRVLVRIADGLGIPRELMNLSDGAYRRARLRVRPGGKQRGGRLGDPAAGRARHRAGQTGTNGSGGRAAHYRQQPRRTGALRERHRQ
jgi:transcriptional regulator with XRE-family HTH domain